MIGLASLGSGSKGNATLVCFHDTLLLIDCGFTAKQAEARLARVGVRGGDLSAILVTHEHADQALLSKQLVTIDRDVPIDVGVGDLRRQPADEAALKGLFAELEFKTWLAELLDGSMRDGAVPYAFGDYDDEMVKLRPGAEAALAAWLDAMSGLGGATRSLALDAYMIIAGLMAVSIVDLLEMIDINQDQ